MVRAIPGEERATPHNKKRESGSVAAIKLRRAYETPSESHIRQAADAVRRARKLDRERLLEEPAEGDKAALPIEEPADANRDAKVLEEMVDVAFVDAVGNLLEVAALAATNAARRGDEIDTILTQIRMLRAEPVS